MIQKQNSKTKKTLIIIGISVIALIVLLLLTFFILRALGKSQLLGKKRLVNAPDGIIAEIDNDENTTVYNGVKYKMNENITSILFIGIDNEEFSSSGVLGKNGQADALYLMAIDTKTGKTKIISISRDTMADIETYSSEGKYLGLQKEQVCLAYAYGDGKKKSCENTVEAVSGLLCGIDINSYYTVDLKAVPIINDSVNGITVIPNEDCSGNGFKMKKGEKITLKGKDALAYIRARSDSVNANELRIQRQTEYLKTFFSKFWNASKKDLKFPISVFNKLSKYSVTDINVSKITYLTSCIFENKDDYSVEFKSIKGEYKSGKFSEFYPDNISLFETVLDVFYEKCE